MMQNLLTRLKVTKLSLLFAIILLLVLSLFFSDLFLSKIRAHRMPNSCNLCQGKENVTFGSAKEFLHFSMPAAGKSTQEAIHVLFLFAHVKRKPDLKNKLSKCMSSLFKYATSPLHLHILTDTSSLNAAIEVLRESASLANNSVEITLYNVNMLLEPLQEFIDAIRPHFSYKKGAYYSDGLFFISICLFKVLPLEKIIIVDADVKFLDDIKSLHGHFDNFTFEALIGIAAEQQPVYRHVLNEYRRLHKETVVGNPLPDGMPGFNSGVLLLNLEKMRHSGLYSDIVNNSSYVVQLVEKYKFKGHLGDQDFYTLVSLEYPQLFYTLPCSWNRQLCQWWKSHGYGDVFEKYNSCNETIHLLHGNCNTFIPDG
ncbi:xyloside xylosyltransferase 1-like [Uloborus diversus]|uniref:xyloside xylosyltransferase 1-like n=1 Tax=Uloborus diversus TaxID=327109 RepID=UPI00240A7230|nr:xyloside xylosyltransferase 1-like [Uloborus diversus]